MSVPITFTPKIHTLGYMASDSMEDIRSEPMLFGCDIEHCEKVSGKITKRIPPASDPL